MVVVEIKEVIRMAYDYGFDLPDTRHTFYSGGKLVSVSIVRHWYQEEDEESLFEVSFDIARDNKVTHLPIGCDESKAYDIAHQLYEQSAEDIEDTESNDDIEAEYAAERAFGA